MSIPYSTARGSLDARVNLSHFIREQAERAADSVGFGWVGVQDAPSTYRQLRSAFGRSKRTGEPLPVSNLYCDDTIYVEPADNVAFRFWHDTSHIRQSLSFSLGDEWELSIWHLDQLEAAGLGPKSREYELLRLDLIGQIVLLGVAGRFPFSQGEFTRTCAELGIEGGILAELRRVS